MNVRLDINQAFQSDAELRLSADGTLRHATWFERLCIRISPEERDAIETTLLSLFQERGQDKKFLSETEKYGAKHGYFRLSNTAFAKRISQIFSLSQDSLLDERGNATDALNILRKNHLHRIIPDVDPNNQNTAIFCIDRSLYIRSEKGKRRLETAEDIALILSRLDETHPHFDMLRELQANLQARESGEEEAEWDENRIDAVQKKLASFYTYQKLEDVPHEEDGSLKDAYYLANGIAHYSQRHFRTLCSTHREPFERKTHTLTIVTRLPAYAKEPNFWKRLGMILSQLFNMQGHGHSWVELTAPSPGGDMRYSVGYYFHMMSKERRLLSPDPQTFLPIREDLLVREVVEITEAQFKKAKRYIEEVQKMLDNPEKRIGDRPRSRKLSKKARKEIAHIYNQAMKATCLSFANALRESIAGIHIDDRSYVRQRLLPQWLLTFSDTYINPFLRAAHFEFLTPISWIMRAEFPAYRSEKPPCQECFLHSCQNTPQHHQATPTQL